MNREKRLSRAVRAALSEWKDTGGCIGEGFAKALEVALEPERCTVCGRPDAYHVPGMPSRGHLFVPSDGHLFEPRFEGDETCERCGLSARVHGHGETGRDDSHPFEAPA